MRVTIRGEEYGVFFSYGNVEVPDGGMWSRDLRRVTCVIKRFEYPENKDGVVVARGEMKCDSRDNFSKVFGRKEALRKALNYQPVVAYIGVGPLESGFNRLQRMAFWQSYLTTHRFVDGRGPMPLNEFNDQLKRKVNQRMR